MLEDLWVPIVVSLVTVVIISPLVGWFIKPHIETRKNKIITRTETAVSLIALVKVVRSNLKLVLKEASKESNGILIPTTVFVLSTRLQRVEQDTRDIIYKVTLLESFGSKIPASHDYGEELAKIAGGALRIKSNVEKNTQMTINGKNGLRKINKRALQGYVLKLEDLLKDLGKANPDAKKYLLKMQRIVV